MNINVKKSYKNLMFLLSIFLLTIIFIIIDTYTLIHSFSILNLILIIVTLILSLILLIKLIIFISIPKNHLTLKDDEIIINNKNHIKYDYIFYSFTNTFDESIELYLINGSKIKIKYLSNYVQMNEIILLKSNKEHFLMFKENKFKKFFHRVYQYSLCFVSHFLVFKHSKILNSLEEIANKYVENNLKRVFIVTSKRFNNPEYLSKITDIFDKNNINYAIYSPGIINPTEEIILESKKKYEEFKGDSLLAIGGGSVIDLTKALGIVVSNKKDLKHYKGLFKVRRKIPFFIAIPSTSGTGSETTMVSVVTINNDKFAIDSNKITPIYTYLGGEFIDTLPKHLLASTSMDALTHAIEAYLNAPKFKKYEDIALNSIKLIHENLLNAYKNNDIESKKNLLYASYLAGQAFNSKFVGNVHALSHALSGKYNLEHGKTNAIILPYCLKIYLFNKKANKKMANLAILLNLTDSINDKEAALKFINYIENLLNELEIEDTLPLKIIDDLDELAKHAYKESVPLYPCPVDFSLNEFKAMYLNFKKK